MSALTALKATRNVDSSFSYDYAWEINLVVIVLGASAWISNTSQMLLSNLIIEE